MKDENVRHMIRTSEASQLQQCGLVLVRRFDLHLLCVLMLAALAASLPSMAGEHAVILIYHHVADDAPPSTSVTPERFSEHLDYLEQNDFRVLPVERVLEHLAERKALPENTVAITFDDAYLSVYNIARPMLDAREMPYAVFVSTASIDGGSDRYMSWEQLRRISEHGGTVGNHGVGHRSALARGANESREEWLQRFRTDAVGAQQRIATEIGTVSTVFAWPYGEYNADVEEILAELGWYGLGQQSGAAGFDDPLTAVPRFPISTGYADRSAFALRVKSQPLPLRILGAPDRLLESGNPPPQLEFELLDGPYALQAIDCFNSRGDRLDVQKADSGAVTVQSPSALSAGRSKYTCTAPHRGKTGVFGWYSHLWVVAGGHSE